jgi:sugar diacid utilization regulator
MKISMWMLFDALEGEWAEHHLDDRSKRICIKGILPYLGSEPLSDEYVYVVDAGAISPLSIPSLPCFFVIAGAHDVIGDLSASQYIFMKPAYSFSSALFAVSKAFERYSDWYAALQEELNDGLNLSRLCEIGSRVLHNDTILYDKEYTIIAGVISSEQPDWYIERNGPYYALSAKAIRQLKNDINFQQTFRQTGAAVCKVDFLSYSVLYVNMGRGSIYEGRLCVTDRLRPFRNGDYQIAEILTEFLRLASKRHTFQANDASRRFEAFLLKLLDGHTPADDLLDNTLQLWHWKRFGAYICLYIALNELDSETSSDRYFLSRIALTLKSSCSVRYQDGIVCVACLSGTDTVGDYIEKLADFLKEDIQVMGVSEVFHDFTKTAQYYRQAVIASDIGPQLDIGGWCYFFEDCALAHFFRYGTSILPAIHFCDQDVKRLMTYRGTRTDYYQTLKVYLENNMNLLETSKALFIHRTTLFNRISKIRELVSADLDNPEDRVRMLISFQLMEADKAYRHA